MSALSARAEARLWPNGFSITTRRQWPSLSSVRTAPDRRSRDRRDNCRRYLRSGPARPDDREAADRLRIVQITFEISHAVGEPAPLDRAGHLGQVAFPFRRRLRHQIDADELKPLWQTFGARQVIERRYDQTLRQIAGSAEDDHGARPRNGTVGLRATRRLAPLNVYVCAAFGSIAVLSHLRPSSSWAIATMRSGSKPNLRCSSLSGADAPKVCMPMTWPVAPT